MRKFFGKFMLLSILICGFFLGFFNECVFAADVKYISADISVVCEKNGTAHINEIWEIKVNSGTEMYLGRDNLENQSISNLKVSSDGKEYQNIENWDTKASLKDKAYKCSIVKNGESYEICWGLSSYGTRVFNVSYDMTNLVKNCSDGSFINQVFINKLPASLASASIKIEQKDSPFTSENTKIWAGGGAVGNIFITDGKIDANLTQSMSSGSNFAILAQFDKDVFSPQVSVDTTFEELKNKELEGTDYKKNYENEKSKSKRQSFFSSVLPFLSLIITFLLSCLLFLKTRMGKDSTIISGDKFRKEYKDPNYSRKLPFDNNIFATYARLKCLRKLENECIIIGVYLLKWIQNHEVTLTKVETKKFFKTKLEDAICLKELSGNADNFERELFDFMLEASDENHVLRKKDFEKWCKHDFPTLKKWLERYSKKGFRTLKEMGTVVEKDKKFLGFINYTRNELSEKGIKLTSEMFGFKKYLEDFTIINEREAKEVELWQDYIIYAQLFGIADKVAEQFKNLYPRYFEERFDLDRNTDIIVISSLANSYVNLAHNTYRSMSAEAAMKGAGGSFSGGGFGSSSGGGSSGVR